MTKKSSPKKERRNENGSGGGRPRKPVTYVYKKNLVMGIGMVFFTFAWIIAMTPFLTSPGGTRIFGYIALAIVSIFNWALIMGSLRLVPWAPKEVELSRTQITFRTVGGRDRNVMTKITGMKMQTNPIFLFSKGLVIIGTNPKGQSVRESVFFGDLGKDTVYELYAELKKYM